MVPSFSSCTRHAVERSLRIGPSANASKATSTASSTGVTHGRSTVVAGIVLSLPATAAPAALVLLGPAEVIAQQAAQTEQRLRVQLRDARLGEAEHVSRFPHGDSLVVVERDHQPLLLRQPRDRLAH